MAAKTVKGILRGAKRIVQQRGWHQGHYCDRDTGIGVCAMGAVYLAAGAKVRRETWTDDFGQKYEEFILDIPDEVFRATEEVTALLGDAVLELDGAYAGRWVPSYNDKPGRTVEEVVAAFDLALEKASEKQPALV